MHIVLHGGSHAKAMMRFSGVIPDQVIDEGAVERSDIGNVVLVVFEELGADGAVETFDVGIGLRVSGVGVEVLDGAAADGVDEVFFELAAVIGLDVVDDERSDAGEFFEEVGGILTVEVGVAVGEGKAAVQVDS